MSELERDRDDVACREPLTVRELQDEVVRLKRERGFCILAHAYQSQDVLEVADRVGDSYALSVAAMDQPAANLMMCGVRFMAETCKVLSPDKDVWLPNPLASCPMADQLTPEALDELKAAHPGYATVAYVNTSSALKTRADACVTSSSAVKICQALPADKILFVPDPNLGRYVAARVPDKTFALYDGGCPYHKAMTADDVRAARAAHPGALLLVHPECPPQVTELADYVGSTTGIMDFAASSTARDFIIGTETSIVEHLQLRLPSKGFFALSARLSCADMRVTTLMDVYRCLVGAGGERIELPRDVMEGAGRCIRRMVELGG